MSASELLKDHPLGAVGLLAVAAPEGTVAAELPQFESAIRDYSLNRTGVDWATVERLGRSLAAQRCDLKIYSYFLLAAFYAATQSSDESPYLALGAALHALGDLIEKGWERCTPRLPARRQTQMKWLSEELSFPVSARAPLPTELPALAACVEAAERVAELSGKALGLDYPLLRELREALAAHKPAAPEPPAPPPPSTRPAPVAPAVKPAPPAAAPPAAPAAPPPATAVEEAPAGGASSAAQITPPANPSAMSQEALEDSLSEVVSHLSAKLRAESLTDPTPYWLMRAQRWAGHDLLRPERIQEVAANKYQTVLPPPPEYKSLIKQLPARLAQGQHADVLAECEELFGVYPLWLDLQRFTAHALDALGAPIARQVVTSQLQLLITRCSEITRFRFSDREGTPLANSETTEWIQSELSRTESTSATPSQKAAPAEAIPEDLESGLRALQKAITGAGSSQRKFELQLQLVELLLTEGRSDIAMPIVDSLIGAIETHHLTEWQPELCERAFGLAVRTGRAAEVENSRRAALWMRLCQISPVAALMLGPESASE